jgi:hypothetical protein
MTTEQEMHLVTRQVIEIENLKDRIERLEALDQARLGTIAVLEKTLADLMTTIGNTQHHLEQAHQALHHREYDLAHQAIAHAMAALHGEI